MSPAAQAIVNFLQPLLGSGWAFQFGQWREGEAKTRYAVLKPAGGPGAELLRRPQFTLSLIGLEAGDWSFVSKAAEALIEAMRASSGGLVYLEPGEPVPVPTANRRPVLELAISAITT